MINKKHLALFCLSVCFLGGIWYFFHSENNRLPASIPVSKDTSLKGHNQSSGLTDTSPQKGLKTALKARNDLLKTDISRWREPVEKTLRTQGGNSVKEIRITPIESFKYEFEGSPIRAESALVAITHQKGFETKFKILVDSSTGKILRSWDHPVIDSVNPREDFRIKIDPRYHQE